MENVILVIHLILAVGLIGIVLLQRSEGGGLGMGGGGGAMTGRQAATAMTKLTWALAIAFLATSITLTIIAASNAAGGSLVDTVPETEEMAPVVPDGDALLPPVPSDAPLAPPRSD
ncbi:preprotein translocase subunit SecG [Jannaschia sp. S6380]|uniref:preprotein translocase subunit SecG n=1 Tax=Jannaschia sp. S6380 TaxID=2926408 RepID=UPI001FF3925C|nr:preprotein translocase subunit SecG [Jannaschia sp. S6380]MCK0167783.1 preprotein translocase subunit SecG [Jannaschia sp. S6380]